MQRLSSLAALSLLTGCAVISSPELTADFDRDGDTYLASHAPSADQVDCDDTDPLIYPTAPERCNGIDDDCDGLVPDNESIDEALLGYVDMDGDGYGDSDFAVRRCTQPDRIADHGGDCDDADATVHPDADELCDGLDTNCDGDLPADEGPESGYLDADGDGYGDLASPGLLCLHPNLNEEADCDDSDASISPAETERCDGVDTNCDGQLSADDVAIRYPDADGDGYGDIYSPVAPCVSISSTLTRGGDCDDSTSTVHRGAVERLGNGVDDDCDGVALPAMMYSIDLNAKTLVATDLGSLNNSVQWVSEVFGPGELRSVVYWPEADLVLVGGNLGIWTLDATDGSRSVDTLSSENTLAMTLDLVSDQAPRVLLVTVGKHLLSLPILSGAGDALQLGEPIDLADLSVTEPTQTALDVFYDAIGDAIWIGYQRGTLLRYTGASADTSSVERVRSLPSVSTPYGPRHFLGRSGPRLLMGSFSGSLYYKNLSLGADAPLSLLTAQLRAVYSACVDPRDGFSLLVQSGLLGMAEVFNPYQQSSLPLVQSYNPPKDCTGNLRLDADGDGFISGWYGGPDCDDLDASINPNALDLTNNDVDENCDGEGGVDTDGDGVATFATGGMDCDDGDSAVFPGAPEYVGDDVDSDCDGLISPNGVTRYDAARTCSTIHQDHPNAASGLYWIDPDGDGDTSNAWRAWCDMSRDGGGWTLVMQNNRDIATHPALGQLTWQQSTEQISVFDAATGTTSASGVLGENLADFDLLVGLSRWPAVGTEGRFEVGEEAGVPLKSTVYSVFAVDPADEYRLSLAPASFTGSASLLTSQDGMSWTTFDRNDIDSNCAKNAKAPFWYGGCWQATIWGSDSPNDTIQPAAYYAGNDPLASSNWGALWLR